jgi:hypothetical protein
MAAQDGLTFEGTFNNSSTGLFKTNTTQAIGSDDQRALVTAIKESYLNRIDDVKDEDDMASNSAAAVPSQQSVKAYVDALTTREFNRTWSAELLFDKDEIHYEAHELTANASFTIAAGGHLSNRFCSVVQEIVTDGTFSVNFTGFKYVLGDVQSGTIPDAGTYIVFFLYFNGIATVNWGIPNSETSNLSPLDAPANFAAVPDGTNGDTELDISWDAVTNASSYELEYSTTGGGGPWVSLSSQSGVTYTHSGLTAASTYHYRVRAIGDQVTYSNSAYTIVAATTEDTTDSTAPVPTFFPLNSATDFAVNRPVTITFDEAIRNTDGSEITDANVSSILTLKETNSGGANISFAATINAAKTLITITPTTMYGDTQVVYVAVTNFEDVNGNEQTTPQTITFTTGEFTLFNGTSNHLTFGDIMDTVFALNDTNFELEVTVKDASLVGPHTLVGKYDDSINQKSFYWLTNGTNVVFGWFNLNGTIYRIIQWSGVLTSGTHKLVLFYDGSIDTNNGLDRVILEIDDVVQGSKTLVGNAGALQQITDSQADLTVGALAEFPAGTMHYASGELEGFILRSASGATVEISVPVLYDGQDTSGNNRDGTWH